MDQDFGSDVTGTRERFDLPYATLAGALADALPGDQINVRSGAYAVAAPLASSDISWYFQPETVITNTATPMFSGNDITVLGDVVIIGSSSIFAITGGTNYFEALRILSTSATDQMGITAGSTTVKIKDLMTTLGNLFAITGGTNRIEFSSLTGGLSIAGTGNHTFIGQLLTVTFPVTLGGTAEISGTVEHVISTSTVTVSNTGQSNLKVGKFEQSGGGNLLISGTNFVYDVEEHVQSTDGVVAINLTGDNNKLEIEHLQATFGGILVQNGHASIRFNRIDVTQPHNLGFGLSAILGGDTVVTGGEIRAGASDVGGSTNAIIVDSNAGQRMGIQLITAARNVLRATDSAGGGGHSFELDLGAVNKSTSLGSWFEIGPDNYLLNCHVTSTFGPTITTPLFDVTDATIHANCNFVEIGGTVLDITGGAVTNSDCFVNEAFTTATNAIVLTGATDNISIGGKYRSSGTVCLVVPPNPPALKFVRTSLISLGGAVASVSGVVLTIQNHGELTVNKATAGVAVTVGSVTVVDPALS